MYFIYQNVIISLNILSVLFFLTMKRSMVVHKKKSQLFLWLIFCIFFLSYHWYKNTIYFYMLKQYLHAYYEYKNKPPISIANRYIRSFVQLNKHSRSIITSIRKRIPRVFCDQICTPMSTYRTPFHHANIYLSYSKNIPRMISIFQDGIQEEDYRTIKKSPRSQQKHVN